MRYYFEPTPNGVGTYDILDADDNLAFRVVERGDAVAAIDLLDEMAEMSDFCDSYR